jgi:hypothetical protein
MYKATTRGFQRGYFADKAKDRVMPKRKPSKSRTEKIKRNGGPSAMTRLPPIGKFFR